MKKLIILQLEVDADGVMSDDDFIIKDLKTEIKCASNDYKITSIEIAEIDKQESKSFIPSEEECREIFCIDALKNALSAN